MKRSKYYETVVCERLHSKPHIIKNNKFWLAIPAPGPFTGYWQVRVLPFIRKLNNEAL